MKSIIVMKFCLLNLFLLSSALLFSQKPELHIESAPTGGIIEADFVPTKPYIFSHSDDNTVRLWHIYEGSELKKWIGKVRDVAVSQQGEFLAMAGEERLKVYHLLQDELVEFPKDTTIISVAFNTANQALVLTPFEIQLWDVSGKLVSKSPHTFEVGFSDRILSDGQNIVTFKRPEIEIINYVTKKTKRLKGDANYASNIGYLTAISRDSKFLALSKGESVEVVELSSYNTVSSFPTSDKPFSISISSDNKQLLVTGISGTLQSWELQSGKNLGIVMTNVQGARFVDDVDFGLLAFTDAGYGSIVWVKNKFITGPLGKTNAGYGSSGIFKAFPGSHSLLLGRTDYRTVSVNLKSGIISATQSNDSLLNIFNQHYVRYSYGIDREKKGSINRKYFPPKQNYGTDWRWEYYYKNGITITEINNPDKKNYLFTRQISVRDGLGKERAKYEVNSWDIYDNGSSLLIGTDYPRLIDLMTLKEVKVFKSIDAYLPSAIEASPSGKLILADGVVFESATGREFKYPGLYNVERSEVCFKPDESEVLYAMENQTIGRVDISTGDLISSLEGHEGNILSLEYWNDSIAVSGSADGAIKFWDLKASKEMATFQILDSINWTVTTPEGLFDASEGAMNYWQGRARMYYVVNDQADPNEMFKIVSIQQLKHRYYQPGLLSIVLGYRSEPLRKVSQLGKIDFSPKVTLALSDDKLVINVKNNGGGIGKISLFVADAEVAEDVRKQGQSDLANITIEIDLRDYHNRFEVDQTNLLKVVAWNREEWLSTKPAYIEYKPVSLQSKGAEAMVEEKPRKEVSIYGIVVGTSDYSGDKIDLKFAAKDAHDFYQALLLTAEQLFGKEKTKVTLLTTDQPASSVQYPTKDNIIKSLKAITNIAPQDVVVLYFSGHGVNYGGQDGDFYYLTHFSTGADAGYLKDQHARENYTLSSKELTSMLNDIPARKKILILDACASGKAAEVMVSTTRDVPASQVRALDRLSERTGFYVLSGSAADAVSYETSVYGQGLLTYALLKAMRGAALRIDGGEEFVDVQKLLQYAVDEVPSLAKSIGGIQQPLFRSPDNQQSYDIGKVTAEVKERIILADPKPVFVASNFQDEVDMIDRISFSELINSQLRDISAKGRQAELVFTEAKDYPNAYRLAGRYKEEGGKLMITYTVSQSNKKLAGPFNILGDASNLKELVVKLLNEVNSKIE